MNWEAAGAIGEIVGAIAVVATLAYLAIQLKQNTKSVQSSAYGTWAQSVQNISLVSISNPHIEQMLRDAWTSGKLTQDTWQPFIMWHQQYFYHLESVWQMFKRGALEKEIFDLEMGRTAQILSTPIVKSWWEAGGNRQVSKPLADELDALRQDESKFAWVLWDEEKGFHSRTSSELNDGA